MAKDSSILPSFRDLAASLRVPAVTPEEAWRARQLRESLASLPGSDDLRRLQEEGERRNREDEWRVQRSKQESAGSRARIAHAQGQIEAWRKVKEKGEAELAALIPTPRTENRTADLSSQSAQTASPSPADLRPTDPPPADNPLHPYPANRGAPRRRQPGFEPPLPTRYSPRRDFAQEDRRRRQRLDRRRPRANGYEPRHASPDTVSRALGRRK